MDSLVLLLLAATAAAKEVVLLDTRESTSELRWETYSAARSTEEGWLEETVTDVDVGVNNRAYAVCQVDRSNVDNWLRTPYIPRGQANRISIEVTFTMRNCELFPRETVTTCGETFTLLYHESDRKLVPEKGDTLPPWRETRLATEGFKKIDRITGDFGRFTGDLEPAPNNKEVRDIPVSKGGVYFAFRDEGACTSILAVKIYYQVCEETVANLAWFAETATGPLRTDLVETSGHCVDHAAVAESGVEPTYICKSDGSWDRLAGACLCRPGYAPLQEACKPCEEGEYSLGGGSSCAKCPESSLSRSRGSATCPCLAGFYRAASDAPTDPCTKPPSRPLNARVTDLSQNSATITWNEPVSKGGRKELWYRADCKMCPAGTQMSPGSRTFNGTKLTLHGLLPNSVVTVFIYAENAVSSLPLVESLPMYAVVEVTTSQVVAKRVEALQVSATTEESISLSWSPPNSLQSDNHPESRVREYQVEYAEAKQMSDTPRRLSTQQPKVTLGSLRGETEYRMRVRGLVGRDWSDWSYYVYATTSSAASSLPETGAGPESAGTIVLIIVGCVIVLCLIVLGIIYATRNRGPADHHRKQPSDLDVLDYRAGGHLTPDYPHNHHFGPAAQDHTLGKKMTAPLMSGTLRAPVFKPYIDPFDYEDPNMALREFTHEIDPQYLYIEQVILGGGEFGEVHQGKLKLPGRAEEVVAIKSLLPNASAKAREDFLQEAAVMGQFEHANVIRLKGVISRSDPVMIITEFMSNKSLDHFLRQNDGQLGLGQQLSVLRGVTAGMKYLSDKGYVHRDLAARNVLVDDCLVCKISDFGLSRGMGTGLGSSEQVYHTKGGKIPVRWTAPEAITHRKYTSASDVWSMGIVIWEVASYGERPYWDWSNQDVIKSVESGYRLPPPLNCPAGLHALMLDCWRRERNERPSFSAILRRLDDFARIPELAYAPSSTANSTLSSDLYDHTLPPSQYHHTTASTLSTPLPHTPSPSAPPPPAPLQPPPLPSLHELLSSLGLAHFARPMGANGVDSVLALTRLGIVDLMTYGLGQADCQRIADAVHRLTASTLPRRHPPLPSFATLSRQPPDSGYFI